ncbi:MAG: hypothetical protein N3A59_01580 [Thermodesulfovibrionales bacterium]|nr:hypothetical protein [Thermodesulfovibrionales bacterium]
MWEYGFMNENFEIVIKSRKDLYGDLSMLQELLKSIEYLTSEIKKRSLVIESENRSSRVSL